MMRITTVVLDRSSLEILAAVPGGKRSRTIRHALLVWGALMGIWPMHPAARALLEAAGPEAARMCRLLGDMVDSVAEEEEHAGVAAESDQATARRRR